MVQQNMAGDIIEVAKLKQPITRGFTLVMPLEPIKQLNMRASCFYCGKLKEKVINLLFSMRSGAFHSDN